MDEAFGLEAQSTYPEEVVGYLIGVILVSDARIVLDQGLGSFRLDDDPFEQSHEL